jgi:hypothetical protein
MKKQMIALTVVTALLATAAAAQPGYFSSRESHRSANLDKVSLRYAQCLECGNDGVIESALAHAILMKLYAPDKKFDVLQEKVNSLSVNGCKPSIRYKAYLASLVYDAPELFKQEQEQKFDNAEELFSSVSNRLQITLLGAHDRKYVRPE